MAGANSSSSQWGGQRSGSGRPTRAELERLVADLIVSLGSQGDADVHTDQVVDGSVVYGVPWSRPEGRGKRPNGVREASRMVARRRLADQKLNPRQRLRAEEALAGQIRRAYYRRLKPAPCPFLS